MKANVRSIGFSTLVLGTFIIVMPLESVLSGQTPPGIDCSLANQLCVAPTGREFSTIQGALNALPLGGSAAAGYTIWVFPGTYASNNSIPNASGSSTNPVSLRAVYPARRPLGGGQWASSVSDRSIINGGTDAFQHTNAATVANWIIDGFYFTGFTRNALNFIEDDNLWVRNNVMIANNVATDEDNGGIAIYYGMNALIQNNLWVVNSPTAPSSDMNFLNLWMQNSTVEFNECRVDSGANGKGRCWYFHQSNNDTTFRYNYTHSNAQCGSNSTGLCTRFRDSLRYKIYNNFWHHEYEQEHTWIHENTQNLSGENHEVHHNTWLVAGVEDDFAVVGVNNIQGSTFSWNIVRSSVMDSDSHAFGCSFSSPSGGVNASNNLWWNLAGGLRSCTGLTGSGNTQTNVTISTTGCATTGADNATHGSNLDVSQVPYRKCSDGAVPACAGMFGQNCSSPAPPQPPAAPNNLRIITAILPGLKFADDLQSQLRRQLLNVDTVVRRSLG
jgi:hypothetical protein